MNVGLQNRSSTFRQRDWTSVAEGDAPMITYRVCNVDLGNARVRQIVDTGVVLDPGSGGGLLRKVVRLISSGCKDL